MGDHTFRFFSLSVPIIIERSKHSFMSMTYFLPATLLLWVVEIQTSYYLSSNALINKEDEILKLTNK